MEVNIEKTILIWKKKKIKQTDGLRIVYLAILIGNYKTTTHLSNLEIIGLKTSPDCQICQFLVYDQLFLIWTTWSPVYIFQRDCVTWMDHYKITVIFHFIIIFTTDYSLFSFIQSPPSVLLGFYIDTTAFIFVIMLKIVLQAKGHPSRVIIFIITILFWNKGKRQLENGLPVSCGKHNKAFFARSWVRFLSGTQVSVSETVDAILVTLRNFFTIIEFFSTKKKNENCTSAPGIETEISGMLATLFYHYTTMTTTLIHQSPKNLII